MRRPQTPVPHQVEQFLGGGGDVGGDAGGDAGGDGDKVDHFGEMSGGDVDER